MKQINYDRLRGTFLILLTAGWIFSMPLLGQEERRMDRMWGGHEAPVREAEAHRGELFRDGKYAMFIHWGVYCQLANKYKDSTYYGISEWIMNPRRAGIP